MDRSAVLVHQVHPAKLAADITASVISNTLFWRHRLGAGLFVRYALPIVASALVLSLADMDRLRETRRGRYVLENMSPQAVAVRLAGDALMAVGSWRRRLGVVMLGAVVVAAGWASGRRLAQMLPADLPPLDEHCAR